RSAPDGSARPIRVARAARDAPGRLRIACSQATSQEQDYTITCLAHLEEETLAAASIHVSEPGGARTITLARGDCATCPLAIRAPARGGRLEDLEVSDVPHRVTTMVERGQELLERSGAGGEDL